MTTLHAITSGLPDFDPDALPVHHAQAIIRSYIQPLAERETVPLRAALGRVLAEDIISPIDVPAHDNSAMDGYALRSADLAPEGPSALRISGTALAGEAGGVFVGHGECLRIMTGAVMPEGCDTVVVQEIVQIDGDIALIPTGQKAGQNRRFRGEDLQSGKPALLAGKVLRPADLGLLASLGIADVTVRRRVRVAFFSTGDELRSLGETLDPGCVYDSNRYTLFGMLTRLGMELIDLGVVRDDPAALEAVMRQACEQADAIVTSGGVSVGEADFTRSLMRQLGDVNFWKIAMKPGRPMAFGRVASNGHSALLFGLPGNPVAVMVTFYAFVRDALLQLGGATAAPLPLLTARSDFALKKKPGRSEYQRGIIYPAEHGWRVRITGAQGSGILRSMSDANCLIVLPHESGNVQPGDLLQALPFEGLI